MHETRLRDAARLKWKYRSLIINLGGAGAIREAFAERGVAPPPFETIRGWQTRNSVPGKYAPLLILIGQERGKIATVSDLWGGF